MRRSADSRTAPELLQAAMETLENAQTHGVIGKVLHCDVTASLAAVRNRTTQLGITHAVKITGLLSEIKRIKNPTTKEALVALGTNQGKPEIGEALRSRYTAFLRASRRERRKQRQEQGGIDN